MKAYELWIPGATVAHDGTRSHEPPTTAQSLMFAGRCTASSVSTYMFGAYSLCRAALSKSAGPRAARQATIPSIDPILPSRFRGGWGSHRAAWPHGRVVAPKFSEKDSTSERWEERRVGSNCG